MTGTVAVMPEPYLQFTGAGAIPARGFGYVHATIPLVIVELAGTRLTVRVRPALVARLAGARTLAAAAGKGVQIFPVRSGATYQGIEFRPAMRSSFYFFTRHRGDLLAALANAGFTVSEDQGQERPVWHQSAAE